MNWQDAVLAVCVLFVVLGLGAAAWEALWSVDIDETLPEPSDIGYRNAARRAEWTRRWLEYRAGCRE